MHDSCLPIIVEHVERTEDDLGDSQTDPDERSWRCTLVVSKFSNHSSTISGVVSAHYSRLKRLCLRIIQSEPKYQNLLVALIHVYGLKNRLSTHMLNTALLSIIFARRIGLSKNEVLDLGMTAFYQNLAG